MIPMTEPAGFTKADLELAAGARSYERGLGYLHAVAGLEVTATEITATVYGSSEYRVPLRLASPRNSSGCGSRTPRSRAARPMPWPCT